MTALMLATNKGHLGVVQDLIQGGADTNKQHPVRSSFLKIEKLVLFLTGDRMDCHFICCQKW